MVGLHWVRSSESGGVGIKFVHLTFIDVESNTEIPTIPCWIRLIISKQVEDLYSNIRISHVMPKSDDFNFLIEEVKRYEETQALFYTFQGLIHAKKG